MTLVDTNVILDLVTNDPDWSGWSIAQLEEAALKGPLCINDVVYAELSVRYARIEDLEAMLDDAAIEVARTPRDALFLAGKVFVQYRKSGGARTGVLPDFFRSQGRDQIRIAALQLQQRPTSAETQPLRLGDLRHAEDQVPAIALNEVPGVRP